MSLLLLDKVTQYKPNEITFSAKKWISSSKAIYAVNIDISLSKLYQFIKQHFCTLIHYFDRHIPFFRRFRLLNRIENNNKKNYFNDQFDYKFLRKTGAIKQLFFFFGLRKKKLRAFWMQEMNQFTKYECMNKVIPLFFQFKV